MSSDVQKMIELMSDWSWQIDSYGRYTMCSEHVYHVLGYHADELLGLLLVEPASPKMRDQNQAVFSEFLDQPRDFKQVEFWYQNKAGHPVCVQLYGTPLWDEEGAFAGYYGASAEMTSQKRDQSLQTAMQRLFESSYAARTVSALFPLAAELFREAVPDMKLWIALADEASQSVLVSYSNDDERQISECYPQQLAERVYQEGTFLAFSSPERETLPASSDSPGEHWLGIPLTPRETCLGALVLQSKHILLTCPEERQRLLQLANHFAMAFETVYAKESARRKIIARTPLTRQGTWELMKANRQLAALYKVGQTITSHLQLEVVLNTLARSATELLDVQMSAILLLNKSGARLRIQGAFGFGKTTSGNLYEPIEQTLAAQVIQDGQPRIANYLRHQARFASLRIEQEGVLACASVPLQVEGHLIGTLDVFSTKNPCAFEEGHIHLLSMLANQAAIAIKKAQLYEKLHQANEELARQVHERTLVNMQLTQEIIERQEAEKTAQREKDLLLSFTEAITKVLLSDNFSKTISEAFAKIGMAVNVDRISIFENHAHPVTQEPLMSRRFEWSRPTALTEVTAVDVQNVPYHPNYSRWYRLLRNKKILRGLIRDFPAPERALLEAQHIMSLLAVPISIHGEFWGFVGFDDCHQERQWQEEEDAILFAMAESIGGVLERQRAQKDLRQSKRHLELLNHMNVLFQTCHSEGKSYDVFSSVGKLLFPEAAGCLYIKNSSRNVLEKMVAWGNELFSSEIPDANEYLTALRKHSRGYRGVSRPDMSECIRKIPSAKRRISLPISTVDEVLGLFQLQFDFLESVSSWEEPDRMLASRWMIANRVAQYYALFLVNLRLRETLRLEAIRDPLTGLYNRRHMEASLEREATRAVRKKTSVGLIIVDLDHFKHINDTHGHEAGDVVLQHIGGLLQSNTRGEDIVCRYGGEEFLLILPDTSLEMVRQRALQLSDLIREARIQYHQGILSVTTSMGVAALPQHGPEIEHALSMADMALYQAKTAGRDLVFVAPLPIPLPPTSAADLLDL